MNLIILGPQGCGKGTQAELLVKKHNLTHISSGDLLRAEAASGTEKGKLINTMLTKGDLVPFDTVLEVLEPALATPNKGFILDGTPRDLPQAQHLDWYLQKLNKPIDHVIFLQIPHDESIKRLLKRAQIENRADDTPQSIKHRLELYDTRTLPVIDYYRQKGLLIEIDGTPDIETIHQDILKKLNVIASSSSLRGGTPTKQSIHS